MTVAATLITRDRVELLERAVASVRPHVDEVFIYDTGSGDRALARTRELDVTLELGEWRDNFAWARAQSFAMVHGDFEWIVWLDDDDVLEGPGIIRDLVAQADDETGVLAGWYEYGPGSTGWRERVVRRSVGWRSAGVVHDRLLPSAATGTERIPPNVLRWVHRPDAQTRDPGRNLRLLRADMKARGRAGKQPDPRDVFYLACEIVLDGFRSGNIDTVRQAIDEARRYARLSLRLQSPPRPGQWLPLPDQLVAALPGDLVALLRQASGVA